MNAPWIPREPAVNETVSDGHCHCEFCEKQRAAIVHTRLLWGLASVMALIAICLLTLFRK